MHFPFSEDSPDSFTEMFFYGPSKDCLRNIIFHVACDHKCTYKWRPTLLGYPKNTFFFWYFLFFFEKKQEKVSDEKKIFPSIFSIDFFFRVDQKPIKNPFLTSEPLFWHFSICEKICPLKTRHEVEPTVDLRFNHALPKVFPRMLS